MSRLALLFLPLLACSCQNGREKVMSRDTTRDSINDSNSDDLPYLSEEKLLLPRGPLRGIVILTVDTLRADHLPMYGYERDTMPRASARSWMTVRGMRSVASWTLPSTTSLFTSLEPARHGLLTSPNGFSESFQSPTWAESLSAQGVKTAVLSGNALVSKGAGNVEGFSLVYLNMKQFTGQNNLAVLNNKLFQWIDELGPRDPFMIHLQPMDLHNPYEPAVKDIEVFRKDPIPFPSNAGAGSYTTVGLERIYEEAKSEDERAAITQAVIDIYDAQLLGLDRAVNDLMNGLAARGLLEETLIVLTADHGETLNDPGTGLFGHRYEWREELVQLPLLFMGPGIVPEDLHCASQNTDLWPTIAGAVGLKPMEDIDGIDLAQGCRLTTRGSLWEQDGSLWWLGAAGDSSALQHDCLTGQTGGTAFGDKADPTETTPPEDIPEGDALRLKLDDALADILQVLPETVCK